MSDTHKPRYRWSHPYHWLRQSGIGRGALLDFIKANCDSDQIQDYFQPDMDKDGYFDDLSVVDCPACDGNDDDCETCGGIGHVSQEDYDAYHDQEEAEDDA